MSPVGRRRVAMAMVATAIALSFWVLLRSDMWMRRTLVGRWQCPDYYSSPASLSFLGGGSYATFVQRADGTKRGEFGTWDVANGELIMIIDHGDSIKDSTTWSRVGVSISGSEFTLINSNGLVGARCSRVTAESKF